ncbi:small GTPase superfamily, Rho type [Kipferlia bialata]|uniref:Small GTPase superfamily, Rho type n=1 Tax=Kipferlia bialata TaxID=797122 RepID=A0A9K3D5R9_9EUKA|nr:small GTPase superfamily, Rho type [Kipferlia bialata]|eukprot:g11533.t1
MPPRPRQDRDRDRDRDRGSPRGEDDRPGSVAAIERPARLAPRRSNRQIMRLKILSGGNSMVGKSCIIKRFSEGRFVRKYVGTIGIDYGVKAIGIRNHDVRVNFWDMAGSPAYLEVRNEFYKDAQGMLLVFDVTNRASFEALGRWITEAKESGADWGSMIVYLVGNKTDLPRRVIQEAEASAFAQTHKMQYWETSAQSGDNVSDMFLALFTSVYNRVTKA